MGDTNQHKINGHTVSQEDLIVFATVENIAYHFGQNAEDATLLRLFEQLADGFYVDIGAYSPTRYSNTFILHHLYGWRGVNIDVSKASVDEFHSARPDDISLQTAVGTKTKTATYYSFDKAATPLTTVRATCGSIPNLSKGTMSQLIIGDQKAFIASCRFPSAYYRAMDM